MAGRIVLFGATGYTGELTARELAGIGERPVLAARDGARVRALADELGGLEWAVADVSRAGGTASVRALVERGDVLISCVGPFARWGAPAVEAAIDAGAHYLDSTGETPFIRRIFEHWGPRADAAGCALLTAMGYDWVPGNLAAALALTDAGDEATRVAVGYFLTGAAGMSGGTRASAAGVFLEPSFAWRGGRIVTERGGARGRSFLVDGRTRKALSAGSSEHFGLPPSFPGAAGGRRLPRLVRRRVGRAARGRARPLARHAASRWSAARSARWSAGPSRAAPAGPDAEARAASGSVIVAEACNERGHVVGRAHLAGVNGYDFTAGNARLGRTRRRHRPAAGHRRAGPGRRLRSASAVQRASARPGSSASPERPMHRRVVRHSPTKRPYSPQVLGTCSVHVSMDQHTELDICTACGQPFIVPVALLELIDEGLYLLALHCKNCDGLFTGVYEDAELEALEHANDRSTAQMEAALETVSAVHAQPLTRLMDLLGP